MLKNRIAPFSAEFVDDLESYCEQMTAAIAAGKHHDQRRALLMDFLRKAFHINVEEVDLEHKVKAASARGRIDAFYRFVIFEVKSDLEQERRAALEELKKYFEAQQRPSDYVAVVTDGLQCEVYDYILKTASVEKVRDFILNPQKPSEAFKELDELLTAASKLPPISGEVVIRFGLRSFVFSRSAQILLSCFESVKTLSSVQVKFREWNALLAKVYGTSPGDAQLFIKHTYLTMLSRAIVAVALFPKAQRVKALYRGLIDGEFFRGRNIQNLAEPDFFSWALGTGVEAAFLEFLENLFRRLDEFDWNRVEEDLLKVMYQELVDPTDRQLLGEFYTPDWLAELALAEVDYNKGTLLDPACGSGTFLFCAIRRLRANGLKGQKLVRHSLESIIGLDVHPVAVLMAKANILLALSDEIGGYGGEVYLRVYLADTLMTGEDARKRTLAVRVGERQHFYIPFDSLDQGRDLDTLVDKLSQFAQRGAASEQAREQAAKGFAKLLVGFTHDEIFFWRNNFELMVRLVRDKRDTVWAFILKNAYRPLYLRRQKVDFVVANPPWLSLRDIEDLAYKTKIKELTFFYKLLDRKDRKLFTQLDTSTAFFLHAENVFLRPGGKMAFVMPKSVILPTKQHLSFQKIGFSAIHEFGDVRNLFKVPTCVLIRNAKPLKQAIPIKHWSGQLPEKNLKWSAASRFLTAESSTWSFLGEGTGHSPYLPKVFQGATILPRCFWFVEPPDDRPLNQQTPYLRTETHAKATSKKPWKVELSGKIEKEFLYGTALSEDVLPFIVRRLRLVVLPLKEREGKLLLLDDDELLAEGAPFAADWVVAAEEIWNKRRKDKHQSLFDRLDYNSLLTGQSIGALFVVLYNKSGTNLSAAYLSLSEYKRAGGLMIKAFAADHVLYRYYADSEKHAHYLVGVLNTDFVNKAIKPYQSQGLQGERDIHRRPFEVCPIPLFNPTDTLHVQIADMAAEAHEKMNQWKSRIQGSIGQARKASRKIVARELSKLNELVKELLKNHVGVAPRKSSKTAQLFDVH